MSYAGTNVAMASGGSQFVTTVVTRKIAGEFDGWSAGLFETVSSASKYTDSKVTSLGAVASTTTAPATAATSPGDPTGQTTITSTQTFGGDTLSSSVATDTAWGGLALSDDQGIGAVEYKIERGRNFYTRRILRKIWVQYTRCLSVRHQRT